MEDLNNTGETNERPERTDSPLPPHTPERGLPLEAQSDQPWPAKVPGEVPGEVLTEGLATADTSVIPLQVAERFPELVAAKEDGRNQMQAARYEHDARTFINPNDLREVPRVRYVNEDGKSSTVSFDAMGYDGVLIDRKLRSAGSSFDRDQLRDQSEGLKQLSERTGTPFRARWEVSDEKMAEEIQGFVDKNAITNIAVVHVPFSVEAAGVRDFAHMTTEELLEFREHWQPYLDESEQNMGIVFGTDKAPDSAGAYVYEWDARQTCGWTDERYRPALPSGNGGKRPVRFDAVDTERGCFIDRKLGAPPDLKGARAQDAALKHTGKDYEAVWQVPNQEVKNKIDKMLGSAPDITRVKVEVVSFDRSELMRAWRAAHPLDRS